MEHSKCENHSLNHFFMYSSVIIARTLFIPSASLRLGLGCRFKNPIYHFISGRQFWNGMGLWSSTINALTVFIKSSAFNGNPDFTRPLILCLLSHYFSDMWSKLNLVSETARLMINIHKIKTPRMNANAARKFLIYG